MKKVMFAVTLLVSTAPTWAQNSGRTAPTCDANGPVTVNARLEMAQLGLDAAKYKDSGLCKLNNQEITNLIFSTAAKLNGPESLHMWDKPKPDSMRHTHVRVLFETTVPEVVKSAFLNRLRSIPDVEIVYGGDEDVVVHINGGPIGMQDKVVGAAWCAEVFRRWRYTPFSVTFEEPYLDASFAAVSSLNDVDQNVREEVATINVRAFEVLRDERHANISH